MVQPQGYEVRGQRGKQLYCRLLKSIYGLKQSGRNWYRTLIAHLKQLDFKPCINDSCLFVKTIAGTNYFVAMWVDDLIYFSADPSFAATFKEQMQRVFTVSDCSELNWFLGMKIRCSAGVIEVSQQQYIESLLQRHGLEQCKSVSTPLARREDYADY